MSLAGLSAAFDAALAGVQRLGAAEMGDKTMVDAFLPAVVELQISVTSGTSVPEALERAASAAEMGMLATIPLTRSQGKGVLPRSPQRGSPGPGSYLDRAPFPRLWPKPPADRGGRHNPGLHMF